MRHLLPTGDQPNTKEFIVSPTAHFCMGGIPIDENAQTKISGLFAAGEVCAGVHGANRLGGNALTEVFTIGGIAGRMAAIKAGEIGLPDFPATQVAEEKTRLESLLTSGNRDDRGLRKDLKHLMWDKAGIIREKSEIGRAHV